MRKLALTLAAALAAAMAAAPAAAVTVTFDAGATTPVNNAVVFQNFDQYAAGTSIGLNANVYNSDQPAGVRAGAFVPHWHDRCVQLGDAVDDRYNHWLFQRSNVLWCGTWRP
jgi:phage tail sheath gpL-like